MCAYSSVAELCVWRLDVFAVVCDLGELGEHLGLWDAEVVEASETMVYGHEATEGLWTNITDCDAG